MAYLRTFSTKYVYVLVVLIEFLGRGNKNEGEEYTRSKWGEDSKKQSLKGVARISGTKKIMKIYMRSTM